MKKALALLLVLFAMMVAPALAADDKPDTPTTLAGGKVISIEEAKSLVDKKAATFFDTRNVLNFGKGHLPGAQSVAYKENSEYKIDFDASVDKLDLEKLPSDKNAPIVFYSDGPKGWKSYKAAVLAMKAGHKNVSWMREGTAGWTAKNMPFEQ